MLPLSVCLSPPSTQAYCQENYLKCTHNDGTVGTNGFPNTYLEPGPDYYAPTGRGHGGACWCVCVCVYTFCYIHTCMHA